MLNRKKLHKMCKERACRLTVLRLASRAAVRIVCSLSAGKLFADDGRRIGFLLVVVFRLLDAPRIGLKQHMIDSALSTILF